MGNEKAVTFDKANRRFEMELEGGKTAILAYDEEREGVLTLTHTEVPEPHEGRGVGSALVKGALDLIESEGLKMVPQCPFVESFVERHPQYRSLVA